MFNEVILKCILNFIPNKFINTCDLIFLLNPLILIIILAIISHCFILNNSPSVTMRGIMIFKRHSNKWNYFHSSDIRGIYLFGIHLIIFWTIVKLLNPICMCFKKKKHPVIILSLKMSQLKNIAKRNFKFGIVWLLN